jgi:hypothetical protein
VGDGVGGLAVGGVAAPGDERFEQPLILGIQLDRWRAGAAAAALALA